jgi:glycosyltransferase involved in cell wall biosynthesis
MAARFSFSKRQDLLIETLRVLKKVRPGVAWKLTFAGDGGELRRLRALTLDLGLEGDVEFPGRLREDELVEWFAGLDIYLHASEGETLSTALLQAMAMGLPIVASEIPGITNLFNTDPAIGVLSPNDPVRFAERVMELYEAPGRRRELAVSARQHCVSSFGHVSMLASYTGLLRTAGAA